MTPRETWIADEEAKAARINRMLSEWRDTPETGYFSPPNPNEAPMAVDVPHTDLDRMPAYPDPEPSYNATIAILGIVLMLMAVTVVVWASGYFWGIR